MCRGCGCSARTRWCGELFGGNLDSGGHAVSVWSAGSVAADEEEEEEGLGASTQGGANDWADVCDALGGAEEYAELDVQMRCQVVECLAQLLFELALAWRRWDGHCQRCVRRATASSAVLAHSVPSTNESTRKGIAPVSL